MAALSFGALGIVFGDIGTSPLYALQTVFAADEHAVEPTEDGVYGVISLVFWAVTIIVSIKYVVFIMRADNDGEGGIMALIALIRNVGLKRRPAQAVLVALGLKKTLLDISSPLKAVAAVALFGGAALYLVAHIAFRLRNVGTLNRQRLVAAGLILVLLPAGLVLPSIASLSIVTAVLVALVTYEAVHFKSARHAIRDHEGEMRPI